MRRKVTGRGVVQGLGGEPAREAPPAAQVLPLRRVSGLEVRPFGNCIPIYSDLKVAAGQWSDDRVIGASMNSRIPDGSWCLWRLHRGGEDRLGKVVLAELVLVL